MRREGVTVACGVKREEGPRELAYRASDGLEVSLLWSEADDRLAVRVSDGRSGDSFELPVGEANPLHVFYHPYAYAAFEGIEYRVAPRAQLNEPELASA
jgi:hypothetical protein